MKNIMIKVFCVLICIFLLCGCDSYRAFMSIESGTAKSWEQRHDLLDGRKSHTLHLGEKNQEMVVEIVTEKGEIDVIAKDSLGNLVFEAENAETGTYSFFAVGKVRITVEADDHKGSISVKRRDS